MHNTAEGEEDGKLIVTSGENDKTHIQKGTYIKQKTFCQQKTTGQSCSYLKIDTIKVHVDDSIYFTA